MNGLRVPQIYKAFTFNKEAVAECEVMAKINELSVWIWIQ
jgi:hypothetical protein